MTTKIVKNIDDVQYSKNLHKRKTIEFKRKTSLGNQKSSRNKDLKIDLKDLIKIKYKYKMLSLIKKKYN